MADRPAAFFDRMECTMDILKTLAQELSVQLWQVEAAVKLIDEPMIPSDWKIRL